MQPRTSRPILALASISLLLTTLPGQAQSWLGGAAVGLQVRGARGPLADARVEILYRGPGGESGGPAPRATNPQGQASFTGVAEGVWSLEISHPQHLSFIATLSVRGSRKTEIVESFLEVSGAGRIPLRVKIFQPGSRLLGTPLAVAATPAPEPVTPAPPPPVPAPEPVQTPETPEAPVTPPESTAPRPDPEPEVEVEPVEVMAPKEPEPERKPVSEPIATTVVPVPEKKPAAVPEPPIEAPMEPESPEVEDPAPTPTEPASPVIDAPTPAEPPTAPITEPEPMDTQPTVPEEPPAPIPPTPPTTPDVEPEDAAQAAPPTPMPEVAADPPTVMPEEETEAAEAPPSEPPMAATPTAPPQEPMVEPPAHDLEPVKPSPAPAVPPAIEAAPVEPSPPPAPTPLTGADGSARSFRDRTCFECKPGEWAVGASAEVAAGGGCPDGALDRAAQAIELLAARVAPALVGYGGNALAPAVLARLDGESRATIEAHVEPLLDAASPCRLLALALPAGARISGFRYEAFENGRGGDCLGDQPCPVGDGRWLASPGIERGGGDGATLLWAVFENRSGTSSRLARFIGYFAPPSGWRP